MDVNEDMLSWENLGAQPPGQAFCQCMWELLVNRRSFFGKMATSGGLHEPLTFFAVVLGAGLLLAFPAALSYFGLSAPDPESVQITVYNAQTLPSKVAGLLVVLLPLVLLVGGAAMVALGTLYHLAGKPFGARNWEGSVSVWLYSAGAALAPLALALAVTFVVSLAGYLICLPWPGAREGAATVARGTWQVLSGAGLLAAIVLMIVNTVTGSTRAFQLDRRAGIAAGLYGLTLVVAAVGATIWSVRIWGLRGGLVAAAVWVALMAALALAGRWRSMRIREGQ